MRAGTSAARALLLAVLAAVALPRARSDEAMPGIDWVDPRVFDLEPLDTHRRPGEKVTIQGRLLGEHVAPEVIVIRPDGRAIRLADEFVRFEKPSVAAEVALRPGSGVYRVEITGLIPPDVRHTGARLRLFAGVPSDTAEEPAPKDEPVRKDLSPLVLEARFFALVNAYRKRARLDPFTWCEPLAIAAREHAQACIKMGRLDHRVDGDGTVANRLYRLYAWPNLAYRLPPGAPNRKPGATSFIAGVLDQGWSLELLLYRWAHFPAFCLPMTSEWMTHAACGIARRADGWIEVVMVYAQVNDPTIEPRIEAAHDAAVQRYRDAAAAAKPDDLRALALWRRKEAGAEARRAQSSPDPMLRAAGWDAAIVLDEEDARGRLGKALATLRTDAQDPAHVEDARADSTWMSWMQFAPDLTWEAWQIHESLPPGPAAGPNGK